MSRTDEYPWYELVEGAQLEQGDILSRCPVLVPDTKLTFPLNEEEVSIEIIYYDLVVVTQSCDLENDKVADIVLCPHWDLLQVGKVDAALASKQALSEIRKGYRHRYMMLNGSSLPQLPLGVRIVDCGKPFCLPKSFIQSLAASQGKRLRLRSPYREHLSQAFARFFMRVGLPQDIQLP